MKKYSSDAQEKKIVYRTFGYRGGVPVVLIHGFCEDSLLWNTIVPYLKNKRVICIDLPGFGGSDVLKKSSINKYAEAIHTVLEKESIQSCILLGHSMGGYTALSFYEKYPHKVQGLGLIHSHPFADSEEKITARKRSVDILKAGKKKAYLNMLFPGFFEPNFIKKNPKVLGLLRRRASKYSAEGIIGGLEAMMHRKDHTNTLEKCSCPVFYFLGKKDTLLPVVIDNEMLTLPQVLDLHVLPEVGHMGMFESPKILGEAIAAFYTFVTQSQ